MAVVLPDAGSKLKALRSARIHNGENYENLIMTMREGDECEEGTI